MSKNIVFCADGTWNGPVDDENGDGTPDPTNVYKLFLMLDGQFSANSIRIANEQEMELSGSAGTEQIAKYIHGVGDSDNWLKKAIGGAFGAGVIARIVRGYTFISRHYDEGDQIYVVGFSRGAYTVRALAGLIAAKGLLQKALTDDPETAYRKGAEAWYSYRQNKLTQSLSLSRLAEIVADLPAFVSHDSLRAGDLRPVSAIKAVGVWDTVGAMGIPEFDSQGELVDAFRFTDNTLDAKVLNGFHAVSLDEQRLIFTPTLWDDKRGGINQPLFPGAHSDVGGGYPMLNKNTGANESGLSDTALLWMRDQLSAVGVKFRSDPVPGITVAPDPAGIAHKPEDQGAWIKKPRDFPCGMPRHPSIAARMGGGGGVVAAPGESPTPYAPQNLPPPCP